MMEYGNVPGIDKPVSRLVFGTGRLSSRKLALFPSSELKKNCFSILDSVFKLGCTVFDTALAYQWGDCEKSLGAWIRHRDIREKVVIVTKGAHPHFWSSRHRLTSHEITADLHTSLKNLQSDYIDLYLLHRDDRSVPVGPLVEILNEHARSGKIRAFGASNWTYQRIEEANSYAKSHGLIPFAVSSPSYSLAEQSTPPWPGCVDISGSVAGKAARQWYKQHKVVVFAWSSLAGGFFSGRFRPDNLTSFKSYWDKQCVKTYCFETNFEKLERAEKLAKERGGSTSQIALAYLFNQALPVFAIVATQQAQNFKANIEALSIKLTPAEIAWLDLYSDVR